jgi:hypothetical protein
MGTRLPNLRVKDQTEIQLAPLRVSTGNGYSDQLTVKNADLNGGTTIDSNLFTQFVGLKKNSAITFLLKITHQQQEVDMDPVGF